jgi:large subunit ribosomal protein L6
MSRIGKLPITIPAGVKAEIKGRNCNVEGPKGKLALTLPPHTTINIEGQEIQVSRDSDNAVARSMHGLTRSLVNNMVIGVSAGFVRKLEIQGVGFKAAVQGNKVNMTLGYSHPINYEIPAQIKVTVTENTKLMIEGPDKAVVGKVASELRAFYPPEPYKGKGVRYEGENVRRKEGKKVQ